MKENTTPLLKINHPLFLKHKLEVWVKLDYLRHSEVQGNKWHKLKLNMQRAIQLNKTNLLTFGGAYSNHIAATAAMAKAYGLQSTGIIRGDELAKNRSKWSPTLIRAEQNGMTLRFVSRQDYRMKSTPQFTSQLSQDFPEAYILPEGGSNTLAVEGFRDFMQEINQQLPDWDYLFTAVGTGASLAGMSKFANSQTSHKNRKLIGVAALKNADYLKPQIKAWLESDSTHPQQTQWELKTQYHHGGYAKSSPELDKFMRWFEHQFQIPIDPIYTGKMLYAFFQEIQQKRIPNNSKILLIHTGGLQGKTNNKVKVK